MEVIEIPGEAESFVLHFDTMRTQINAYAFASSMVGLANAIKDANAIVNPGYVVEVVVEGIGAGSFRAILKAIGKTAHNVFSHEASKAIIYGIIATWIYEQTFGVDDEPVVIVNDGSVEIHSGDRIIIVPREVYEAKSAVERSERFNSSMGKFFSGALQDADVTGLRLTPVGEVPPLPSVPREKFRSFIDQSSADDSGAIVEEAFLEISRAILSRGRRKWEFYWRGIKISAPVLDDGFFDLFIAHDIKIAPGDVLNVMLKVYRRMDPDSGIVINTKYEIIQVLSHIPRSSRNL